MDRVQELIKALEKAVEIDADISDYNEVVNYEEYFTDSDTFALVKMIDSLKSLSK